MHQYNESDAQVIDTLESEILFDEMNTDNTGFCDDLANLPSVRHHEEMEWKNVAVRGVSVSLEARLKQLTPDQHKVFQVIKSAFDGKQCPFHLFVSGGAGVGRSILIDVIVDYLRLFTSQCSGIDPVAVCAPTGVAAFNVKGKTVHSLFRLPVSHSRLNTQYQELPSRILAMARREFHNIHTIIIDEVSMVGYDMLEFIHKRLTVLKRNDALFGGINIIAVGDFFQLRPVRNRYAFENIDIWSYFKPYLLTQNMRQRTDSSYLALLSRIRTGIVTEANITTLQSRLITSYISQQTAHILHIFPTIKQVQQHNEAIQSTLPYECFTIHAKHIFSDHDLSPQEQVSHNHLPLDDRDAGGLLNILRLSINTRVMLLRNLNTHYGRVNGAIGTVRSIYEENGLYTVKVQFDGLHLPPSLIDINGSITIPYYKQEFLFEGRFIIRENLPLMPCWSSTIHKVQGLSLDQAVVYIGPDIFVHGQAYVALSRVRTLQGLHLLSLCPRKITADPKEIAEYLRLQYLTSAAPDYVP